MNKDLINYEKAQEMLGIEERHYLGERSLSVKLKIPFFRIGGEIKYLASDIQNHVFNNRYMMIETKTGNLVSIKEVKV